MANIPAQPRTKVIRALTKAYQCRLVREGKKHKVYGRDDIPEPILVPRHKTISSGVLRNIAKILGVKDTEFLKTLRQC